MYTGFNLWIRVFIAMKGRCQISRFRSCTFLYKINLFCSANIDVINN